MHNRDGEVTQLAQANFDGDAVRLKVMGDYVDLGFHYSADGEDWRTLIAGVDGSVLAPERIGGYNYTGVYIGLYGSMNGPGEGYAVYDFMEYRPMASGVNDWFYKRGSE